MKDYPTDPDFLDLLAALHDNRELSEQRMDELLNRVKQDSDLRRELAAEIQMAALTDTVRRGETRWSELEELLGNEDSKTANLESAVMSRVESDEPANAASLTKWLLPIGIAAALALLAISLFKNQPTKEEHYVARLIRIDGELHTESGRKLTITDRLTPGDKVTMSSGLMEMAFVETGVHVLATAPLSITTDSRDRIFVHGGEVKVHVPPQGVGFVVETLEQKITDLGTSFVVTARDQGSRVLVLDGEITVDNRQGGPEEHMYEGDHANFDREGVMKLRSRAPSGVPELSFAPTILEAEAFTGRLYAFSESPGPTYPHADPIGERFLPLIQSRFTDHSLVAKLKQSDPIPFLGVVGTYDHFPKLTGVEKYTTEAGWMVWYSGKTIPPASGKYRFWGYADNHLMVAVNGKPVFEGSRYWSALREKQQIPRRNHPSLPCLNSTAGFASGEWFEVGSDAVQMDILFGELGGTLTSGLLLIERQGESYSETFWGQPKWPLFLSAAPTDSRAAELDSLVTHMERNLRGSFSVDSSEIWKSESSK